MVIWKAFKMRGKGMGIKKRAKKAAATLATELAEAESSPLANSPLANKEQKKLSYKKKIEEKLETFQKECSEGFQIMIQGISSILWGKEKERFVLEMESLLQKVNTEEKLEAYLTTIGEGKTWREVLSISDFFMESLYKVAVSLFNAGKYEEAISSFTSLAWIDSKQYIYFVALGFSLFHANRYEEALYAYFAAAPYAPDTSLFLYLSDCYEKIGKREKAKMCLEAGLQEEETSPLPQKERLEMFQKKYQQLVR